MSGEIQIPRSWLDERQTEIDEALAIRKAKIKNIHDEMRELRAERNILNHLLDRFAARNGTSLDAGGSQGGDDAGLPSPSEAVDSYFVEHPGTDQDDAVEEILAHGIDSDAQEPRGVVMTALRRRLNSEKLWRDAKGRVWPWDHPKAQSLRSDTERENIAEKLRNWEPEMRQ